MDNKKKNAAIAMTTILAASIVVNPMAVPVYAQETDTTVIEQQTEKEESVQTPNEESGSQKPEDVPTVTEQDIPATNTAVSYTHLDVYKRQGYLVIETGCSFF